MSNILQALGTVVMCITAAVLYGIAHDQITVRICIEYFTVGHPQIFHTEDPTLLALGWGIIATWWVGALLGLPLALAARVGKRPKRSARSLVRPVACLLGAVAVIALLAGIIGWILASTGAVILLDPIASKVAEAQHVPFLTALWAHSASYIAGFIGGIALTAHVWRSRCRQAAIDYA